jgi:hypothetical protein
VTVPQVEILDVQQIEALVLRNVRAQIIGQLAAWGQQKVLADPILGRGVTRETPITPPVRRRRGPAPEAARERTAAETGASYDFFLNLLRNAQKRLPETFRAL